MIDTNHIAVPNMEDQTLLAVFATQLASGFPVLAKKTESYLVFIQKGETFGGNEMLGIPGKTGLYRCSITCDGLSVEYPVGHVAIGTRIRSVYTKDSGKGQLCVQKDSVRVVDNNTLLYVHRELVAADTADDTEGLMLLKTSKWVSKTLISGTVTSTENNVE